MFLSYQQDSGLSSKGEAPAVEEGGKVLSEKEQENVE
jgi:hypothetical protein